MTVRGELAFRLLKNYARLEDVEYRPETVFDIEKNGWPGDWEGRTILALTLLERATGRYPAYLDGILEKLTERMNHLGYMKHICPDGIADEQQLSGHNWLLRGLLERYRDTQNPALFEAAKRIFSNLYLPLKGKYASYPLDPAVRSAEGAADGTISGEANGWILSTDIGCAFMPLDALSQYYVMTGDSDAAELIEEMFTVFRGIDFVGSAMQTHASLSACRGLLRYAAKAGREEITEFVKGFFDLYQANALTANYANHNWFTRPLWTESCAVVDSFILALDLFDMTGEYRYMRFAHRAYFNALAHAQRSNGGFGCDECCGEDYPLLKASSRHYEAYWCCSMRGAEGLYTAAVHGAVQKGGELLVTGLASGQYGIADVESGLPLEGRVKVTLSGTSGLRVYIPDGIKDGSIRVSNGREELPFRVENGFVVMDSASGIVVITFDIAPVKEKYHKKYLLRHGDVLLTSDVDNAAAPEPALLKPMGKGAYRYQDRVFAPPESSLYVEKEKLLSRDIRIVFD